MTGAAPTGGPWKKATACALVLLLAAIVSVTVRAAPAGALEEAISLYRAAQYQEALAILDGLGTNEDAASGETNQTVAEYRALCLLALDREDNARAIVQALIERRPAYRASDTELPPRYVAMVSETRSRLWPSLVRAEYRAGKVSYERKAFRDAADHFRKVAAMLAEDGGIAPQVRDALADVGDLARDFLALSEKAAPDATLAASDGNGSGNAPASPGANGASARAPVAAAAAAPAVYGSGDAGVIPPVVVKQDLPQWRADGLEGRLLRATRGVLEVVIDTSGRVESAQLKTPVHPLYDGRLLAKTKEWAYRPALREGVPVRFRKTIEVQLVARGVGQAPEWP